MRSLLRRAPNSVPVTSASPVGSVNPREVRALGVPVERTRAVLVACSVGLAAVATAAGPIGFIALAAPQLARRLTRTSGSGLMGAAVTGAALLTVSDWAAQRWVPGHVLPVGVATGAVGGVYLTWILYTEWRRRA
jgi:iron-siderophore transport system permease protein